MDSPHTNPFRGDTYKWTANPGAHGHKYQRCLASALFARGSLRPLNFKLAVEMLQAGKFDDVVYIDTNRNHVWLFQCKHSKPKKTISYRELFERKGGDFDLHKYLKSYVTTIEPTIKETMELLLFTNGTLVESDELADLLTIERRDVDEVMNFGGSYVQLVPVEANFTRLMDHFNNEFNNLQVDLIQLFCSDATAIPKRLGNVGRSLAGILNVTQHQLKFSNCDEFTNSKLYSLLEERFKTMGKRIESIERGLSSEEYEQITKMIRKGDSRLSLPVFFEYDQVRKFLKHLTLCMDQPEDLLETCDVEIKREIRRWIAPEILGKFTEKDKMHLGQELQQVFSDWINEGNEGINNKRFLTSKMGIRCISGVKSFLDKTVLGQNIDPIYFSRNITLRSTMKLSSFSLHHSMQDEMFIRNWKSMFGRSNFMILIGEPGMGKTLFLRFIAHQIQMSSDTDVYFIPMIDLRENLRNVTNGKQVYRILRTAVSDENIRNMFDQKRGPPLILFDGFNELPTLEATKAIDFLKHLSQTFNARILISGRTIVQKTLEQQLATSAMSLVPFEHGTKIKFLKRYFHAGGGPETNADEIETLSNQLVEKFHPDFTGNPLMLWLLVKVYMGKFYNFSGPLPEELPLTKLYDRFVEATFMMKMDTKYQKDAYLEVKSMDPELQPLYKDYVHVHQLLAIAQLGITTGRTGVEAQRLADCSTSAGNDEFSRVVDEKFQNFLRRVRTAEEKSVLVNVANHRVEFVHLNYAEYFAAKHLYAQTNGNEDKLFEILKLHENVRRFFLSMVEENFDESPEQLARVIDISSSKWHMVFWACECKCFRIVQNILTQIEIEYNTIVHRKQGSLLHVAARIGFSDLIPVLVDSHGFRVDLIRQCTGTALHYAAEFGHVTAMQLLIERGANVNARTAENWTPLLLAVRNGSSAAVKCLIQNGARIDAGDNAGVTALHLAVFFDNSKLTAELLECGASLMAVTNEGLTAISLASRLNHLNCLQIIATHRVLRNLHVTGSTSGIMDVN